MDYLSPTATEPLRTLTLEAIQVYASQHLPRLPNLTADVAARIADVEGHSLVMSLSGHVYGDHLLSDVQDVGYTTTTTVDIEHRVWWAPWRKRVEVRPVRVSGTVKVKAKYFATFPDLPEYGNLGESRRLVQVSQFRG